MQKFIALAICFLLASLPCFAKDAAAGRWEGTAQIPGYAQHVVIDIDQDSSGAWIGSIIIPELNIKGAPLTDISKHEADLSFAIKDVLADAQGGKAKFQAHLDTDHSITGTFTQAGNTAPFTLTRTGSAQVDLPPRSTPVAREYEGKWIGDYELGGYARHVTLSLTNHAKAAASAEFVIVGKKVNNLPVDLLTQDGAFLRIESHAIGINFEGRLSKDNGEIDGTYEQGPFELPLVLRRATGK